MKNYKWIPGMILAVAVMAISQSSWADGTNAVPPPPKPDLLKTCPVSGDKLGEMDKPYVFTYKDQEMKLCCKMCKADFDKDPAKYMKKIRAGDKKEK